MPDPRPAGRRQRGWAVARRAARYFRAGDLSAHRPVEPITLCDSRSISEEMTQKAASRLGDARSASVNVRMVNGFAAKELIDASHDADLIVVGSRGGGGFGRLMMGSVSSQVVHHAACPVVVVPHER